MKRLVLIDGHNLLFRMFYGIPASIKNSKGVEIRGVIGFIGSLRKLNDLLNPTSMAVIFDSETSKKNNAILLDCYKSNRPDYQDVPAEENPFTGLDIIKKSLTFLDIPYYEVIDNEADDYIASLVQKYRSSFDEIIIISNDSDFFQLIDEKIYIYVFRGKQSVLYDKDTFKSKFHILPNQYVEYKSLVGDHADNIKGVKGIGKKTAEDILTFPSIEQFYHQSHNERLKNILLTNTSIIERNIKLITLNQNLNTTALKLISLNNKVKTYKVYEILTAIQER